MADNPFARAVNAFIADFKRNEDIRSPFYQQVLVQTNASSVDAQACARHLADYVQELELRQRRTSKLRLLSDKLQPLLNGLNQYVQAFDVIVQAGPEPVVLLYGGARLILQLGNTFSNCFEVIVSVMEDIGHLLKCYHLFSSAYPSAEMQSLLVSTYKNIISFWAEVSKLLGQKTIKAALKGIIKPLDKQWQKCRQSLLDDSSRVQMLAQAMEADIRHQKEQSESKKQEDVLRSNIVNWIRANEEEESLDVRSDIRDNLSSRHPETCKWLFEHASYKDWLTSKDAVSTLWYNALPGTGKTILASTVAQKLQDEGLKTATFLFAFDDVARRTVVTALRCLGLQLLVHSSTIPDSVKRLYEEEVRNYRFRLSDLYTARQVVEGLIRQLGRIHIIIDGLDECREQEKLWPHLVKLLSLKPLGLVKWFLVSRSEAMTSGRLSDCHIRELQAPVNLVLRDIKRYVSDQFRDQLNHECNRCVEHWTTMSEGNFLWVKIILRILQGNDLNCREDIRQELRKFPRGLESCYVRGLAPLAKRSRQHQLLARRIFHMIVGAAQPLRLSEISHALAAKDSKDFEPRRLPEPRLIQDLCSNLVTFDQTRRGTTNDPLLKFAHKSVYEFFLEDPTNLDVPQELHQFFANQSDAKLELGKSCLAYLDYKRYHRPQSVISHLDDPCHAFLRHAATFWHHYLYRADHSRPLFCQVEEFVQSQAFWSCISVQSHVVPYLFALYRKGTDKSYRMEAMDVDLMSEDASFHYGIALPEWIDEYQPGGPGIAKAFHSFVREWHPVLTSHPALHKECVMSPEFDQIMPGRRSWVAPRVKFHPMLISEHAPHFSKLNVIDFVIETDSVLAYLVGVEERNGKHQAHIFEFELNLDLDHIRMKSSWETRVSGAIPARSSSEKLYYLADCRTVVDLESLQLIESSPVVEDIDTTQDFSTDSQPEVDFTHWTVVSETSNRKPETSTVKLKTGLHLSLKTSSTSDTSSMRTSSYRTDSSRNSDSDSESEASDDERSISRNQSNVVIQNCMILILHGQQPIKQYWKGVCLSETHCCSHPTKPLVVWSQAEYGLSVADMTSRKIRNIVLPEPVDVRFSCAAAIFKQFHFSDSGDSLYYLLCVAENKKKSVQLTISLSSFQVSRDINDDLQRDDSTTSISYEFPGSSKLPTILTFWSSAYVYFALPPLSCNPKIGRLSLMRESSSNARHIQTLSDPIFTQSSTPRRRPRIKYIEDAGKDILTLSLDAEIEKLDWKQSSSDKPPALITWDCSKENAWRPWDIGDERTEDLRTDRSAYEVLRGSFIDEERRFDVPIRNGLDHTRKAVVSCA